MEQPGKASWHRHMDRSTPGRTGTEPPDARSADSGASPAGLASEMSCGDAVLMALSLALSEGNTRPRADEKATSPSEKPLFSLGRAFVCH
jgi:hypothetical protein